MFHIREVRIKLNKSQQYVADILGVSRGTYSMWESENEIIPIKKLIVFCEYFNINLDYILGVNEYLILSDKFNLQLQGERLKDIRKKLKFTQEKLANIMHVSDGIVRGYEKNRYIISTPFLYTICKKYNISADYLLGRIDYIPDWCDKKYSENN